MPHRLFGHVDGADAGYSAARWASDAKAAIAEALAEDRLPILVGGTGLYLRTLLDGIAPVPAIDASVRAAVRALPVAQAHAALMVEDPAAAARLNPADTTRVARALEVVRSTGRPLAAWQAHRHGGIADTIDPRALVLLPDRDWLFARIAARFADMLATGLEEVAALVARTDLAADAPIRRAIGVPEATALLAGNLSSDEAAAAGALATRRYAKRQYTWFRNQLDDHWHRIPDHDNETRRNAADILLRN